MKITGSGQSSFYPMTQPAQAVSSKALNTQPVENHTESPTEPRAENLALEQTVIETQDKLNASIATLRSYELRAGLSFLPDQAISQSVSESSAEKPSARLGKLTQTQTQMQKQLAGLSGSLNQLRQQPTSSDNEAQIQAVEAQLKSLSSQMRESRTELVQLRETILNRSQPELNFAEESPAQAPLQAALQVIQEQMPGSVGEKLSSTCLEALSVTTKAASSQAQVEQRIQQVNTANQQVDSVTRLLADKNNQLETMLTQAERITSRLDKALQAADNWLSAESTRTLDAAQLTLTNQALSVYKMVIEPLPEGEIRYQIDDQTVDAERFWQEAQLRMGRDRSELESLKTQVPAILSEVRECSESLRSNSEHAVDLAYQAEVAMSQYEQDQAVLELATGKLKSMMADPSLPPDVRQALGSSLSALETQVSEARQVAPLLRQQLTQARTRLSEVLTGARQELERSLKIVDQAQAGLKALSKLGRFDQALSQLQEKLKLRPEQLKQQVKIAQRVAELIAEADELEARLELAPSVESIGIESLLAELTEIIKRNRELFDRFDQANLNNQILKDRLDWEYLGKVRENNDYHSLKLSQVSEISRHEAIERAQAALFDLKNQLQSTSLL